MNLSRHKYPRRVLAIGRDEELLLTRKLLLESAGFTTDIVTSTDEFKEHAVKSTIPYDLFLLCHTVSIEEQRTIDEMLVRAKKVYQLSSVISPDDFLLHVTHLIDV